MKFQFFKNSTFQEFGDGFNHSCDLFFAQFGIHGQRKDFLRRAFRVEEIARLVAQQCRAERRPRGDDLDTVVALLDMTDQILLGLVVGVDSSETMLGVAVRDNLMGNVAYVRGDARDLPFRDRSFDAVCCFAALYLIEEPMRALAEIVRVLAPGGKLALMSSCNRGPVPTPAASAVVRGLSGVRVFGRDELIGALEGLGAVGVEQRVIGLAQFVSARKPARP